MHKAMTILLWAVMSVSVLGWSTFGHTVGSMGQVIPGQQHERAFWQPREGEPVAGWLTALSQEAHQPQFLVASNHDRGRDKQRARQYQQKRQHGSRHRQGSTSSQASQSDSPTPGPVLKSGGGYPGPLREGQHQTGHVPPPLKERPGSSARTRQGSLTSLNNPYQRGNAIDPGSSAASTSLPAQAGQQTGAAQPVSPLNLEEHEGYKGGHTIEMHADPVVRDLQQRLLKNPPKNKTVSTFTDEKTATSAMQSTLAANQAKVQKWLASKWKPGKKKRLELNHTLPHPVGVSVTLEGNRTSQEPTFRIRDVSQVKVVLERDSSMESGYRIVTGYPTP